MYTTLINAEEQAQFLLRVEWTVQSLGGGPRVDEDYMPSLLKPAKTLGRKLSHLLRTAQVVENLAADDEVEVGCQPSLQRIHLCEVNVVVLATAPLRPNERFTHKVNRRQTLTAFD